MYCEDVDHRKFNLGSALVLLDRPPDGKVACTLHGVNKKPHCGIVLKGCQQRLGLGPKVIHMHAHSSISSCPAPVLQVRMVMHPDLCPFLLLDSARHICSLCIAHHERLARLSCWSGLCDAKPATRTEWMPQCCHRQVLNTRLIWARRCEGSLQIFAICDTTSSRRLRPGRVKAACPSTAAR